MIKKLFRRTKKKIVEDSERGARKKIIEELFYDFNQNRHRVYLMNFVRGIMFGVGSVIGGTVVIALIAGILSMFTDIPGGLGGFIQSILDAMSTRSS